MKTVHNTVQQRHKMAIIHSFPVRSHFEQDQPKIWCFFHNRSP